MELLKMPRASENMVEGTVGEWLAVVGQELDKGDQVVEIITEKAQFELECEKGGTLLRVLAQTRATVPVGYVLCVLVQPGESPDINAIEAENERLIREHLAKAETGGSLLDAQVSSAGSSSEKIKATPRARRLAKKSGISLKEVKDTLGIEGILQEEHVRKYRERQ
ncbi:MAG: biotin/lipoyl-containing protein [Planctomycetota bacterium]|nr:biotin/lipoyl-containing protein [Planctomycetota bacterium]